MTTLCIIHHIYLLVTSQYVSTLWNFNYFSVSVVNYIYCEIATVLTSYMNIFVVRNVKPLWLGGEVSSFRRYVMLLCVFSLPVRNLFLAYIGALLY